MKERRLELREALWPGLDESLLWDRKKYKGFTTIPRTLPYILDLLDNLSGSGMPLFKTYLSLWCRSFDEGIIEIKSYADLAYESGFSGPRAVSMWKKRMEQLVSLGFVLAEKGNTGEFDYVLLLNPYPLIKQYHKDGKVQKQKY